jgi:dTMP kinase
MAFVVCVEGINGSGKTTQVQLLKNRINADFPNLRVETFIDPGVTEDHEAGKILRQLVKSKLWDSELAHAFLFLASKLEISEKIRRLPDNCVVLLDRYIPSIYAYQGMTKDLEVTILQLIHSKKLLVPQFTYILSCDVGESLQRAKIASDGELDVFEKRRAVMIKVSNIFSDIMKNSSFYPGSGRSIYWCPSLDTNNKPLNAVQVNDTIWESLTKALQHFTERVRDVDNIYRATI